MSGVYIEICCSGGSRGGAGGPGGPGELCPYLTQLHYVNIIKLVLLLTYEDDILNFIVDATAA